MTAMREPDKGFGTMIMDRSGRPLPRP